MQGRPTNAQVVYEKFTHEMTPTRMRIALTMRVVYMGPVRDITTFVQEEVNVERRIPFDIEEPQRYNFVYKPIEWASNNEDFELAARTDIGEGNLNVSNTNVASANAARKAHVRWKQFGTIYDKEPIGDRHDLWKSTDCSGFVWGGFADNFNYAVAEGAGNMADLLKAHQYGTQSMAEVLGWSKFEDGIKGSAIANTGAIKGTLGSSEYAERLWWGGSGMTGAKVFELAMKNCIQGDIMLRIGVSGHSDHVAFFWEKAENENSFKVLHAASPTHGVTIGTYSASSTPYNYCARVFASKDNHDKEEETDDEDET